MIRLSWLLFFLSTSIVFSQVEKYWPKGQFPHLVVDNKLWIGTPRGLYQYLPDDDTWAIYGQHNGLPSQNIEMLQYDGELLWVVTPEGLAAGDIRLNKWLIYNQNNGLPTNKVNSIAFQEDYVWVATNRGAARFDKLIQEWEHFTTEDGLPDSVVKDVIVEDNLVYFATRKGLAEYEVNFEKWRIYPVVRDSVSCAIQFIYPTTDYLWLFTDTGPFRFNKKLHSLLSFPDYNQLEFSRIQDLVVEDKRFWAATDAGVFIYDPANTLWRPFQEQINLPDSTVKDMTFIQNDRWFVTQTGVALFDQDLKSWNYYGKAHGLSSEQYQALASFQGRVFLLNNTTIDYYLPTENRWRIYSLKDVSTQSAQKTPYISLDREKGSFLQITPDTRFSLSGTRWTSRFNASHYFNLDTEQSRKNDNLAHRRDLKAQLTFYQGQTVNAFYNDSDLNQTLYGIRYKGLKGDLVQEINWGDIRYEQGKSHLIPSLGVFGSSARLEAGSKTEQYGRSLISAQISSGEKTTGQEIEFFTGNRHQASISIRDIDYIRNTFFRWDTTDTGISLDRNSVQIFMDDGNKETNTPNTLLDYTVGGMVGDFDKLIPYKDYSIDYKKGEFMLISPASESSVIVLKGKSTGIPLERVIKTPEQSAYTILNRYFAGGIKIIPASFRLQIMDSTSTVLPLSRFGLDDDGNVRVDSKFIDTEKGILTFPRAKPFPSTVYLKENPQSSYLLQIQFETEITIFMLKNNRLIRESETVTIDGEVLKAGDDYVLDYTSGSLLILREGVVAEDSEIEVQYEFYRESSEKFHVGGLGFGPSDNVLIEVKGFSYDNQQQVNSSESMQGIDLFGEFKWKMQGFDFKLTPEFAQSLTGDNKSNSIHIRTDISSQQVRLYSEYEKYDKDFKNLFPRQFQLGKLQQRLAAGATVLPTDYLDFTAQWSKQQTPETASGKRNREENLSGKFLLSKQELPALSLSLRHRTLDAEKFHSSKKTIKGELEYNIPDRILNMFSFKSLRIYGVWRKSWENRDSTSIAKHLSTNKLYENRYLRFDFSPLNLVQINAYYRGETVHMQNQEYEEKRPLNQQQKWFLDATVDRIKGINLNVRYQSEITQRFDLTETRNSSVNLQRLLQTNIRFFPGQWVRFFTPFTFELNINPGWKGTLEDNTRKLNWDEKLWQLSESQALVSGEDNMLYQIRGEWRPSASFFFYTGVESFFIDAKHLDSYSRTRSKRLHQKVEYQPSPQSLITLQYFYNKDKFNAYKQTIRNNPMLWVEHRWSDRLQTKLNLAYQWEEIISRDLQESMSNFTPLIGLTYRWRQAETREIKAEIRNDFSFVFYRHTSWNLSEAANSYSNTLAVDFFPSSIIILRFRLTTVFKNKLESLQDNLSNSLELRLTAQF